MKRITYAPAYPMDTGTGTRTMVLYFGVSLALHLIFLGSMMFWPASAPKPRFSPGSINVSLVSLPGSPRAESLSAAVAKPAAKPVEEPKKVVKAAPIDDVVAIPPPKTLPEIKTPKKTVSLTPTPKPKKFKPKKSLKEKTQNRQKMIDHALTKVKKKVEKSETDSVSQALDRIKKEVEKTEAGRAASVSSGQAAAGTGGGGVAGAPGSGGLRRLEIIDIYKVEIAYQIERNWAFSQQLAGEDQRLEVRLVFKVMPNGEITDIRFTENSGNSYLDESAYRAIVKANPVSPHPTGVRAPYVTVGVRFTPEGIRR
jgi:colicin import membrane protein